MRDRTTFLIDGFNLYHSVVRAQRDTGLRLKWLNISEMCRSFLPRIGNADLDSIFYFSAFAYHLGDTAIVQRHQNYLSCLEHTGIVPHMSRFKEKETPCLIFNNQPLATRCPACTGKFITHQEKETDVAIACKLLSLLTQNATDCVVIMTGDTDLSPAIQTARSLYPKKRLLFASLTNAGTIS